MGQRKFEAPSDEGAENVQSFSRSSARDRCATALDLVYKAADIFHSMEEHARETEARAQELSKNAMDKLRRAEMRAEAAERAQRELIINADQKLQDASRALQKAHSRIEAQEDQLTALELRAQVAEVDARQAKEALALVEQAIRRRLLCANPQDSKLTNVA
jgi:hypothetical protein